MTLRDLFRRTPTATEKATLTVQCRIGAEKLLVKGCSLEQVHQFVLALVLELAPRWKTRAISDFVFQFMNEFAATFEERTVAEFQKAEKSCGPAFEPILPTAKTHVGNFHEASEQEIQEFRRKKQQKEKQ